jgi:hypothetical protein
MFGVEWRAFDHPEASDDLILAQPCTYIPHSILKIEKFLSNGTANGDDSAPPRFLCFTRSILAAGGYLIRHVIHIKAPMLVLIIHTRSS